MVKNSSFYAGIENELNLDEINGHLKNRRLQHYLSFYEFDITKFSAYRAGFTEVDIRKIFFQLFYAHENKGSILIVHGYLDHSGGLSRTVNVLLKKGYNVAAVDLPGHGMSQGEGGHISSFDEYAETVKKAYDLMKYYLPAGPCFGVGHSTGAGVLFQTACDKRVSFDKLLLAAPLYLPVRWPALRGSVRLFGNIIPRQKRRFKRNSKDKQYHIFTKKDPLQAQWMYTEWLKALETWQLHINDCPFYRGDVYIIQGGKDTTVDWRKNLRFFRSKCSNLQVSFFPRARHQLLNEERNLRKAVEHQLLNYLGR
jgi:alpha-beta hydrolase superfamily lysophospholipase